MNKRMLVSVVFCLALIFILSSTTGSKAQAPDPTATPTWVKPTSPGDELPPFLNPPPDKGELDQAPQAIPNPPDMAYDWNRMVFQSYRDGNWEVYSAYGNGLNQANISNRSYCSDARPKVNRDLTRVVFNADPSGSADIYVMNYDGTGLVNLTDNSNRQDFAGAWSPDGSRIAYVSNVYGAHRSDPVEIYVMNADGSAKTRLTYSGVNNDGPNWSPDGTLITWRQNQASGPVIMAMNADGSNQHALTPPLNYLGNHAWSPDSASIAIDYDADGDGWNEIAVMNADGTGMHTIYDPGCTLCDAWVGDWGANGQYILISKVNYVISHGNLYLLSTYVEATRPTGGGSMQITSSGYDLNPSWSGLDLLPPVSQVNALPEYSLATGFDITWSAVDQGPSGLSGNYEFQYRLGASGSWVDLTGYTFGMTSMPFSSETYDTAYFRSRAMDRAENWEPWPAGDGNTATKLYSWLFDGKVMDQREIIVPGAGVSISPTPWEQGITTDRIGEFLVHIKDEGAHTLNASHAGYGALLPANAYIRNRASLDRYLAPVTNLLVNGGFEASPSQPAGWAASGAFTPTMVTGFSGNLATGLGFNCPLPCLTAPEVLTPTGGLYSYPKMVIDPIGNLHLIFVDPRVMYLTRATNGTWSEPFEVGLMYSGNDPERTNNDIATDPQGGAHVVWKDGGGLVYRERRADGTWAAAKIFSEIGTAPKIATDHSGGIHVIYTCDNYHCPGIPPGVYYLTRPTSGAWSSPVQVASIYNTGPTDLTVGPDHTVHILFGGMYVSRKPDGTLTEVEHIINFPDYGQNYNILKLEASGVLHAFAVISGEMHYSYKLPGASWSIPESWYDGIYFADMDLDQEGRLQIYGLSGSFEGRYIIIDRNAPRTVVNIYSEGANGAAIGVDLDNNLHLITEKYDHLLYQTTPHALTDTVSALSQVVSIPANTNEPTLSFMYKLWGDAACQNSEALVSVTDALTTTQVWSDRACSGWAHAWIDMSPWTGQAVTVTFALHQAAGDPYTHLYLDEISLGAWMTPIVTAVTPDQVGAGISTTITISGENFVATPTVKLNEATVADVEWVDAHTLRLHLPEGLPPGIYTIQVINPGGADGISPRILKVGKLTYMPIAIRPAVH